MRCGKKKPVKLFFTKCGVFNCIGNACLYLFGRNEYYKANRKNAWVYFSGVPYEIRDFIVYQVGHGIKYAFSRKYRKEYQDFLAGADTK